MASLFISLISTTKSLFDEQVYQDFFMEDNRIEYPFRINLFFKKEDRPDLSKYEFNKRKLLYYVLLFIEVACNNLSKLIWFSLFVIVMRPAGFWVTWPLEYLIGIGI
jgi:hypothetical protein